MPANKMLCCGLSVSGLCCYVVQDSWLHTSWLMGASVARIVGVIFAARPAGSSPVSEPVALLLLLLWVLLLR